MYAIFYFLWILNSEFWILIFDFVDFFLMIAEKTISIEKKKRKISKWWMCVCVLCDQRKKKHHQISKIFEYFFFRSAKKDNIEHWFCQMKINKLYTRHFHFQIVYVSEPVSEKKHDLFTLATFHILHDINNVEKKCPE